MLFEDIVIKTLKTNKTTIVEDEMLEEGVFLPITPFLALTAFKQKVVDTFKRTKAFRVLQIPKEIKQKARDIKGSALIVKEKAKAYVGAKSAGKEIASVYKLTPEQNEVLADILNKYGEDIVKEIAHFRTNVLAPYQLIKRLIKKNKSLTSTDITGMNKEQFMSALESGRRKIRRRGVFFEKSQEIQNKLRDYDTAIRELENEKNKLSSGKDLDNGILEKVYNTFNVGEGTFNGYSLETLKTTYEELTRNMKALSSYKEGHSKMTPQDVLEMVRRQRQLKEKGISKDVENKEKKENEEKKGNFSQALSKYMIRRSIRENFKSSVSDNVYKQTYLKIVEDLIDEAKEKKAELLRQFVELRKTIDFNEHEGKIWQKLPSVGNDYSGEEKDYYQKYKEEDFGEPTYYERPEKLQQAEQEIENEIKRFERKLATIVSKEDLARMKKYRLINNIITVNELKDPDDLFRTQAELQELKSKEASKREHIREDEYVSKLKEWATKELEDEEELDNNKKQAKELAQRMREQGDGDIVEVYHDLLRQVLGRKTLEARKLTKEVKEEPVVEQPEESENE